MQKLQVGDPVLNETLTLTSSAQDDEVKRKKLWDEMVNQYKSRLQDCTSDLHGILATLKPNLYKGSGEISSDCMELKSHILKIQKILTGSLDLSDNARTEILIKVAHNVQNANTKEHFLNFFRHQEKEAEELYLSVCTLGQFKTDYEDLLRAAEHLPSLANLIISPVDVTFKKRESSSGEIKGNTDQASYEWSLDQTFKSINVPFDNDNIRMLTRHSWDKATACAMFDKYQAQMPQIHPEMHLLIYVLRSAELLFHHSVIRNTLHLGSFPLYIGSSGHSCFLCCRFLQAYGGFQTRGFNGKIDSVWTFPEVDNLMQDSVDCLKCAIVSTEVDIFKTVTWSNEATTGTAKKQKTSAPDAEPCPFGSGGLTTADHLVEAVWMDKTPDDPQTARDYGFANCKNWTQQSHLLGVYQGLVKFAEVKSLSIHQWRLEGTLVENIIRSFEVSGESSRSGYYSWFLKHKDLLNPSYNPKQALKKQVSNMVENAISHLNPEDRPEAPNGLVPSAKKFSFFVYAGFLQHSFYPPNVHLGLYCPWYDFGFCVCRNEAGEQRLSSLYDRLVSGNQNWAAYTESLGEEHHASPLCTFDEFWRAFEGRTLIKLMDKYGFRRRYQDTKHLEAFLSVGPRQSRPTVWKLCQLLALDDLEFPAEVMSEAEDYGFSRKMTPKLKSKLKSFYRALLRDEGHYFGPFPIRPEGDPLELHDARREGKALEYAQRCLGEVDSEIVPILQSLPRS